MEPIKATSADVHVPAVNTAAVLTYAADVNQRHVIGQVTVSYDAAPTAGLLTITNGGTTVFSVAVTAAGPAPLVFEPPLMGSYNSALVITLAAAGAAVTGRVNARHWMV